MDKLTVANTIALQMGGAGRIRRMLGRAPMATTVGAEHGLVIRWPSRHASRGNSMTVLLDEGKDTYKVTFHNVNRNGAKVIKEMEDVYCDDLVRVFEEQTGWVL